MRCISPVLIRSNGRRDFVPCGKCNFCLQTRRFDWSFRLAQELNVSKSAKFITLTYAEESPWFDNEVHKDHLQLFFKRLRKVNSMPLRYYAVGEYGTKTGRAHYHAIVFNITDNACESLPLVWSHGLTHVGTVTPASIHYVTKYVINKDVENERREPPFALMSRRPGLGSNYLISHRWWHREDFRTFAQVHGVKTRLPRFYKDKFFTQLERKQMQEPTIRLMDESYFKELERLQRFCIDASLEYDERVRSQHDSVKSKINSLNKF